MSPTGDDAANGTTNAPLRTLGRAIAVAPSGATLVLRTGTYHETIEVPENKTLTIQSAAGEAVWLDGSTQVDNWRQSGSLWVKDGWTAKFDSTPSYTNTVPTGQDWGFVNPAFPMAAHPDQVWVNGTAQTQVSTESEVKAGSFYVDYAGNRLVLGTNPNGADVRASSLGIAATIRSANSVLRGIGIRRYGTAVHDMGAVRITGLNVQVENLVTQDNATTGLSSTGPNEAVRHVTLERNGMLGMHGNNADGLVIDHVISQTNNTEQFNHAPVSGGIKITRSRGVVVRGSILQGNRGPGLWLDESVYNAVIVGNHIINNDGHGVSFEISARATMADNVITGNSNDGMKINNSSDVRIWNNTLGGNGRNVELVQDSRNYLDQTTPGHDPRQAFPDPTMTWKIANIQLANTILDGGPQYHVYVRDYTGQRSAAQMGILIDGNLFLRTADSSHAEVVWQLPGGALKAYNTVAEFGQTGAGSHNAEVAQDAIGAASTQRNALALPADIAALVGRPTGTQIIGAFS